jgi:cellulose synthase/poly-beta-1,6-N-acetylglucosamine synthase-like glycosyltransferase
MVYTLALFPAIVFLRSLLFPMQYRRGNATPKVSVLIAAYNEAEVITDKIANVLDQAYPSEQIEVIVASDGSDDATNELVRAVGAPNVRLLALPRQGKNTTLNAAAAVATGEILVFTDADTMFAPDVLRRLTAPFADPSVGGVGGDYSYRKGQGNGNEERTYWKLDRALKALQSRAGNMTSATGQIYALRRELFTPIPVGVTDDFYASTCAISAGKRLVFEPQARAEGPIAETAGQEFRRKVRVMTAGFKGVWMVRHLLNPFRYGFYALQLFSHKVLRRLMAVPMLLAALSAPFLWRRGWIYKLATLAQIGLHGLALAGYLLQGSPLGRKKPFSVPFFFDMVNLAAVVALINLLRGKRADVWVTQRASTEDTPQR